MNIAQAKEQIAHAVRAYLSTDEQGRARIPQHMQRPLVVFGPPGLGKTAVAAQVADELGINFVAYSMTHHTRQSALGLPYISTEEFDGKEYRVSDYTMSEILAAVHRSRKASGVDEGILFLDEVNCVSETLSPAMLQFLQFKTFGMHRLPDRWVIVCAGNPPEYNRSAREFDPATLDRIKRIDVEPDLAVWQTYAHSHGVHPAVTTFLETKPSSFYHVGSGVAGPVIVTARGWDDLSLMLHTYEAEGIPVDAELVGQYLQDDQTAREFFAYYNLFCQYESDYRVADILDGNASDNLTARAADAPFDERIALVGLLLDAVLERVHCVDAEKSALDLVREDLVQSHTADSKSFHEAFSQRVARIRQQTLAKEQSQGRAAPSDPTAQVQENHRAILERIEQEARAAHAEGAISYDGAKESYNAQIDRYAARARTAMDSIDCAFRFLDQAFGELSQESLILVTKLSADPGTVRAVTAHGSEEYLKHNKALLLSERNTDLIRQIEELDEQ